MSKRSLKPGFTRIDLLVAVAILGILIAGWLPAVEQNREAARRAECMNKLKQLGLSLLNHHDVYKKFPPTSFQRNGQGVASVWWPLPGSAADTGAIPSVGYTSDAGTTSATAGYSWIVRLLPYMDEAPLYNTISQASGKFLADAFTPYNVEAKSKGIATGAPFCVTFTKAGETIKKHFAAVQLDELACPSYSGSVTVAPSQYAGTPPGNPPPAYGGPEGNEHLGSPAQRATISNYVALSATHFPCMRYGTEAKVAVTTDVPVDADAPNGMIVPGTGLNIKDCTDGASKTLIACETIEPAMNCWYDGTTTWTTAINPNSIAGSPPTKANPTPAGADNPSGFWNVPAGGSTSLNVGPDPNSQVAYSLALAGYCATPQMISWGPSSGHPGGVVNHLTVDGAAHALTADIDPTLYMHLVTRAGGEPDAVHPGN